MNQTRLLAYACYLQAPTKSPDVIIFNGCNNKSQKDHCPHVLPVFDGRILPVDTAVAIRSTKLHVPASPASSLQPLPLVHFMTVIARNIDDIKPTGVTLLNPWMWDDPQ